MSTIDISMTSTSLPSIARSIGIASATSVWIMNSYYLIVVAALLPFAALGEIYGHRRVFLIGTMLFLVGALASGLAGSLPTLIGSRTILALGSAAISAVTPALVRFIYPPSRLGRGLGTYALVVALAFTAGPTIASTVLAIAGWRWLYLVHLPFGVVALVVSVYYVPATPRSHRRFDIASASLSAAFFAAALFALAGIAHHLDWSVIALSAIASIALGYLLLRREQGRSAPILAVDLFKLPLFSLSSATSICAFTVQGLAFIVLPFLLHEQFGFGQSETGLLITPWPAALAATVLVVAPLADRFSPGILATGGLVILAAGLASVAYLPVDATSMDIVWRLAVCGLGFGFFQSPNMRAIMASAPPSRSGGASGIVAASRLFGQAIGAAIVALCLSLSGSGGAVLAISIGAGVAIAGSLISAMRLLARVTKGTS
ncbi:multidrug MFS transporter [Rhizobium sp. AAP43]|nr:multidrug MFS transporter [Rhizobium sp. AAP43]